jgi:hypothetical protein
MAQTNWTQRVLNPVATQELLEVGAAARDLAQRRPEAYWVRGLA